MARGGRLRAAMLPKKVPTRRRPCHGAAQRRNRFLYGTSLFFKSVPMNGTSKTTLPLKRWSFLLSTHALLFSVFNPPTPCGVGQEFRDTTKTTDTFQSTHPVRGGTKKRQRYFRKWEFQSTHPVRGGTSLVKNKSNTVSNFNPPTPCGVDPPRAGWDEIKSSLEVHKRYFNPPTPCGVGRLRPRSFLVTRHFNPPTPCGVGLPYKLHVR